MLSKLRLEKKMVGSKQAKKAVINNIAKVVYIAEDADDDIKKTLEEMCDINNVEVFYVENMRELGKACGIEVRAASAAILK